MSDIFYHKILIVHLHKVILSCTVALFFSYNIQCYWDRILETGHNTFVALRYNNLTKMGKENDLLALQVVFHFVNMYSALILSNIHIHSPVHMLIRAVIQLSNRAAVVQCIKSCRDRSRARY